MNPELAVEEDENSRYAVGVGVGRPSKAASEEWIDVVDTKTGEKKVIRRKTLEVNNDEVINNYVAPRLPSEPVPIRTPAQIMRIWVAPYVDTNGDLVAPGFVYTEIEPRRWIYPGDEQVATARCSRRFRLRAVIPHTRLPRRRLTTASENSRETKCVITKTQFLGDIPMNFKSIGKVALALRSLRRRSCCLRRRWWHHSGWFRI